VEGVEEDANVDRLAEKETERASGERTRAGLAEAYVPEWRDNGASVVGLAGTEEEEEKEEWSEEVEEEEWRVRKEEEEEEEEVEKARTAWQEGGCSASEIVGDMVFVQVRECASMKEYEEGEKESVRQGGRQEKGR